MSGRRTGPFVLVLFAALTACGGDTPSTTPPPPPPTTGSMTVTLGGLPPDRPAAVTVNGPAGYTRQVTTTTTLTDLAPGQYTLTAPRVQDVGLAYDVTAAPAPVTVTAGETATRSVTYEIGTLPRSTTDRADEGAGSRFKVFYVLPSDGVDHNYDTNRLIHRTLSSGLRWLASRTGGKTLRIDTSDGKPDITFVRLGRTDATMAAFGAQIRDQIENELATLGFTGSDTKLYLVFYDGSNTANCGSSAIPPVTPGRVAAMYFRGGPVGVPACETNAFATTPFAAPGYREFVMLHEMIHDMGGVTATAPDYVALGHVNNDPTDLMYAGAQPWAPARIDYLNRNYYNPAGLTGGLWNLATSPFLY